MKKYILFICVVVLLGFSQIFGTFSAQKVKQVHEPQMKTRKKGSDPANVLRFEQGTAGVCVCVSICILLESPSRPGLHLALCLHSCYAETISNPREAS